MNKKLIFCLTLMLLIIIAFVMGYLTKENLVNKEGYMSSPEDYTNPLYTQSNEPEIYTISPAKIPYINEELQILDNNIVVEEFETRKIDGITQHFYTKTSDVDDKALIYTYFEIDGINYDLDVKDSIIHKYPSHLNMVKTELIVDGYPVYSIRVKNGFSYSDNIYIIFKDVPTLIAYIENSYEITINDEIVTCSSTGGAVDLDSIYVWRDDALYLYNFPSYFNAYYLNIDYYDNTLSIYRRISENAEFGDVYKTDFKIEPFLKKSLKLTITEIQPAK